MTGHRGGTMHRPLAHQEPPEAPVVNRGRKLSVRRLVVLALVVAMGLASGWLLRPAGTAGPRAGVTAAPSVVPSRAAASSGSPDVTWQDVAGLSLPVSATAGPRCREGGRASCFAHSDAGAALAAVHLLVRTFPFAGSAVFVPTIRDQVTGRDATTLLRLTSDTYAQVAAAAGISGGAPIPSEDGWVAGYTLDPSTTARDGSEHRTVHVLIRQADGESAAGFTEYTVELVWRAGDWALVAPAWGDWRSAARAIESPDPTQYVSYDAIGRS